MLRLGGTSLTGPKLISVTPLDFPPVNPNTGTSSMNRASGFAVATLLPILLLLSGLVIGIYLLTQKTGFFNRASSPDQYAGILRGHPNSDRCRKTGICFTLSTGSSKHLVTASSPNLKAKLNASRGKRITLKATELAYKKNGLNFNYLAVSEVKTVNLTEAFKPKTLLGMAGGVQLTSTKESELFLNSGATSKSYGIFWGIYWQGDLTESIIVEHLDREMQLCKDKHIDCNLIWYSSPDSARTKAIANRRDFLTKHPPYSCATATTYEQKSRCVPETCYGDPLDDNALPAFKEAVAKIAERYDGDGQDDAPGSPKAASFAFLNEQDSSGLNTDSCGHGVYAVGDKYKINPFGTPTDAGEGDLNSNKKPDYADYADHLKAFYEAVKGTSDLPVAFGGIIGGGTPPTASFTRNVLDYSQKTYGTQYFDLFNFHHYLDHTVGSNSTSAAAKLWAQTDSYSYGFFLGKIKWYRDLLAKYGGEKPVIITEMGYCAGSDTDTTARELQAKGSFKVLAQMLAANVASAHYYTLRQETACNLVNSDTFEPRPAYFAFQTLATELAGYSFSARETNNTNYFEGYIFTRDGSPAKEVIWLRKRAAPYVLDRPSLPKNFPYPTITVISKDGTTETEITDGGIGDLDSKKNGIVQITITDDPILVVLQQ